MAKLWQTLEKSDDLAELAQGEKQLDARRYLAQKAKVELHHANQGADLDRPLCESPLFIVTARCDERRD
jgi:hypothetical protein